MRRFSGRSREFRRTPAVGSTRSPFGGSQITCAVMRRAAVMHVLYLIFNEGYASSSGEKLQRVDLSHEAIRLTRALSVSAADSPEVTGLLALMLLTDARRAARTGPGGELIPLDEQDR